ncbi:C-X-C chemokine receptor type 3-like [Mugil cephalus]|uniref:C-X-C chemokine receptor type 3-like n=1 Tax=Mugil cephalus TaxID=48193 RepID=UPI001FB5B1D8|nr:C-X-C chemokine receptor type 3-like [Mugil cephalus]
MGGESMKLSNGNLSLFDGFDDLYNDNISDYDYNDSCCEERDFCEISDTMNFGAVFIPILYSVVFIVGFLGNGALVGVLVKSRRSWNVTDTFILHLGVADILLLLTLPLWAAQAAQSEGWTFGTPLCKITGAVFTINFYCGIFLLACISLERYLSVIHASQMYSNRNSKVVHISCVAVWVFSMILSIPDWIFLDAVTDDRRNRIECVRNYFQFNNQTVSDWRLASRTLYHIVGFLLPSVVLIFCYSCIWRRLRCGIQGLRKQRAFRVIVAVVVVFFLCWTPYNITLMVDTIYSHRSNETCGIGSSLEKAIIVTTSIGFLHCSLNPILYAFMGVKFRLQLLDIMRTRGWTVKKNARVQLDRTHVKSTTF